MRVVRDPDHDLCPCRSGKILRGCCMRPDGTLIPDPAPTPVPPDTGFRHPSCYAAGMGGCSSKVSREHSISEGVLKLISRGAGVNIGGLTWLKDGERRTLPTKALASHVLCENHNSSLSALDALALRFLEAHLEIARDLATRKRRHPEILYLFNGEDLERWMLKCLCGLVASGNAEVGVLDDAKTWRPSSGWLERLFGLAPVGEGCGLLVTEADKRTAHFEFAVLSDDNGPYGLAVSMLERDFMFSMSPVVDRWSPRDGMSVYRPARLLATNDLNKGIVQFGWTAEHSDKTVESIHANPRRRGRRQRGR